MRLFLDANVLFSAALSPVGAASSLFAFAGAGACELVTSAFVVAEATRNLRVKAPEAVDRWERLIASVGIVVEADARLLDRIGVALPAKDRPVLAAALGCRATVLVTGDRRHFGPLFGRRLGGTVVLSPRAALAFLVEASGDSRSGADGR
ncbi:MAG: PIN domain-containing protein [Trueperaceae bacterium]|nr:PIN domain-containing protein [Trueperaceae bacterium]